MATKPLVHVLTAKTLPSALAAHVRSCETEALARGGRFIVALSGGSMPQVLGQALAGPVDGAEGFSFSWDKWHVFYADERCVPLDHAESNHHACAEHFFSKVCIPAEQLHPLRYEAGDEADAGAAAARYTAELAAVFTDAAAPGGALPALDLVLLGMGADGHTASLFPGHALLLAGAGEGAAAPWVAGLTDSPKPPSARITLTLPVLSCARNVAFISGGTAKAEALLSILDGKAANDADMLPAGRVTCAHAPVHWFVDAAAAAALPPTLVQLASPAIAPPAAWAVTAAATLPPPDAADPPGRRTIVGFGSLLSEASARSTFPELTNFRLGRVRGWRRVFAHPAGIFFLRGIADAATGAVSSLSAERDASTHHLSFGVALFEVPLGSDPEALARFVEREEEFELVMAEYQNGFDVDEQDGGGADGSALMCARSTDATFRARIGEAEWARSYGAFGVESVWDANSAVKRGREGAAAAAAEGAGAVPASLPPLLPCAVYARHCVLAASRMGDTVRDDFLDTTFLADRATTLRAHLGAHPELMETLPPPALAHRYSG